MAGSVCRRVPDNHVGRRLPQFRRGEVAPVRDGHVGPVAGAVGASKLCAEVGLPLAITADVGGTSFDTCLLVEGRPRIKYEGEVVGMPLQTPWVDVRSVGAGGGSIASTDRGLLNVGPRSAGAYPGPVCYGRGGTEPTVTDAAVTLGMLARDTLASGLELDTDGAASALARLGEQLGLDAEQAARGVLRVAGATMAGAIRAVSIEVGEDPRSAALIAYGGRVPCSRRCWRASSASGRSSSRTTRVTSPRGGCWSRMWCVRPRSRSCPPLTTPDWLVLGDDRPAVRAARIRESRLIFAGP